MSKGCHCFGQIHFVFHFLRVKSAELDVCQNEMKKMKHENGISESR